MVLANCIVSASIAPAQLFSVTVKTASMSETSQPIETVLVPTDGSDGALAGAKRGVDLAVAAEADVHVLSVIDTAEIDDEERAAIEAEAETAVEAVTSMITARDIDPEVTTAIEHGKPFRAINTYVDDAGVDMIAMGTNGRTGLERVVLGSVTENVLRTVDIPVLTVPADAHDVALAPEAAENVLLPTDGSEGAAIAVDWGVALADTFDAMVHAIYSADTSRLTGSTEPDEILSALEDDGQDALETVRERARETGVSLTGTVASGPPARVILDYTTETDIAFIVIGTHGRSGIERHLIGSVTETVVRNADIPVVCVPISAD